MSTQRREAVALKMTTDVERNAISSIVSIKCNAYRNVLIWLTICGTLSSVLAFHPRPGRSPSDHDHALNHTLLPLRCVFQKGIFVTCCLHFAYLLYRIRMTFLN